MMLTGDYVQQILQGERVIPRTKRTIYQLPNQQVNRILVCGKCAASGISPALVTRLLREGLDEMLHKIEVYQEYGYNPEVSRGKRLERGIKWREDNEEYVVEARAEKERNRRLNVLRGEMGGTK
jgi:hypothetical protein